MERENRRRQGGNAAVMRPMEHTVTIMGDSMLPDYAPGEVFRFIPSREVTHDGVYYIRIDGYEMVKQVQRLPGRRLRISSINDRYAPVELEEDNPAIEIIGHSLHDASGADALFRTA